MSWPRACEADHKWYPRCKSLAKFVSVNDGDWEDIAVCGRHRRALSAWGYKFRDITDTSGPDARTPSGSEGTTPPPPPPYQPGNYTGRVQ